MILWFSGTGNSRYAAELLASELGQSLRQITPDMRGGSISLPENDNTLVWVCPVYSWGLPPYIRSVIASIRITPAQTVNHLVLTCGDDCGLAADMWRSDLKKRGWQSGRAFSVIMPNNYVCMSGFDVDSTDLEQKKLAAVPQRIREITTAIKDCPDGLTGRESESSDDIVRGRFAWIKTKIIYPWFVQNAMSPTPFHSTKSCISCGKCAAVCPLRNIEMQLSENGGNRRKHPVWGQDCAFCLACYHICPRHAVMYGSKTIGKGQYMNPFIRK